MTATSFDILDDLARTLRATGVFAAVDLGPAQAETAVPRAAVILEGTDRRSPDDTADGDWFRLRARVVIRTHGQSDHQAADRIAELIDIARDALGADPTRGGICTDLPIGPATEIGQADLVRAAAPPVVQAEIAVRCHFSSPEAA